MPRSTSTDAIDAFDEAATDMWDQRSERIDGMQDEWSIAAGRRVVTGLDAHGKSSIVSDEPTRARVTRPDGSLVMDLWRVDALPPDVEDDASLIDEVRAPSPGGLVVKMSTIPPGGTVDPAAYARAMTEAYGKQSVSSDPGAIPGMHRTDTVDVVTIVSGELYAVLQTGETVLRAGDTIVQRGTKHAWQNRSQHPVTLVSVMMDASRSIHHAGGQTPS